MLDTLVVSVVPHCNLRCIYCQNAPVFRGFPRRAISVDLVRVAIKGYVEVVSTASAPVLRFCFSGGEPLLAGRRFFSEVVRAQNEIVPRGMVVRNVIQTNGTLLNDDWAEFLERQQFRVSVTIDGPSSIHDLQRPMGVTGRSSWAAAVAGISRLRQHGVSFGTLSVVSKYSLGHAAEILRSLRSLSPDMMGFLPCVDEGPALSPGQFGDFMIALFDEWLRLDDPECRIREFWHIVSGMAGLPHTKGCQYAGCCPRHVNVSPDGSVSVCDQYIGKTTGHLSTPVQI